MIIGRVVGEHAVYLGRSRPAMFGMCIAVWVKGMRMNVDPYRVADSCTSPSTSPFTRGDMAMTDEIQLVSDGDGLAVIGRDAAAVQRFLRRAGLWTDSKELDLHRLRPAIALGAEVVKEAAEFASHAGRWVKLTEESARLVQEHGLMESKTEGVRHLMVGTPGNVQKWLQTEHGLGSIMTNPQVLSGVAGIMTQAAAQQSIAEIKEYLARIDEKVDAVLRKVDDTVLKDMDGARSQIRRAATRKEAEGRVTGDSWSEVQTASGKIGDVQAYALRQLRARAETLEQTTRVGGLAHAAQEAEREVAEWLAVLAECFQLQEEFDVLVIDRAIDEPAEALEACRRGLAADRRDRLDLIAQCTGSLLARMDAAVGAANAKLFWNRGKAPMVIESGRHVALGVDDFHRLLGISGDSRSWEQRRLGRIAEIGAQVIQKTKTYAPAVATAGALVVTAVAAGSKARGDGES